MGLGIAEVDQHPITQILGDMSVQLLDHLRTGGLVGPHYIQELFRVKVGREGGRIHQIAKQHRELAAFGLGGV
jgi:hypothetical protein